MKIQKKSVCFLMVAIMLLAMQTNVFAVERNSSLNNEFNVTESNNILRSNFTPIEELDLGDGDIRTEYFNNKIGTEYSYHYFTNHDGVLAITINETGGDVFAFKVTLMRRTSTGGSSALKSITCYGNEVTQWNPTFNMDYDVFLKFEIPSGDSFTGSYSVMAGEF